jgi:hypothetical protein
VFLVLALYRLFRAVNETQAKLVVILGALVSVPIVCVNVFGEIAALSFVGSADFLSVFDRAQRDAMAYLFLRLHGNGIAVASIFWGLWLFPFGMLVIRSGFIPRAFGVVLILAGAANLANATATLALPQIAPLVSQIALPIAAAELSIVFWLLIWGAQARPTGATPGAQDCWRRLTVDPARR